MSRDHHLAKAFNYILKELASFTLSLEDGRVRLASIRHVTLKDLRPNPRPPFNYTSRLPPEGYALMVRSSRGPKSSASSPTKRGSSALLEQDDEWTMWRDHYITLEL